MTSPEDCLCASSPLVPGVLNEEGLCQILPLSRYGISGTGSLCFSLEVDNFFSIYTGCCAVTDMLEALLKGKLPGKMENMEDALTSMFFGAFRLEPTGRRILKFLNKAECISGSKPDFAKRCQVKYDDYEFWPRWHSQDIGSCEPDVFITIDRDKEKPLYVLIEAKYHSGISSPATTDGTHQSPTRKRVVPPEKNCRSGQCGTLDDLFDKRLRP